MLVAPWPISSLVALLSGAYLFRCPPTLPTTR